MFNDDVATLFGFSKKRGLENVNLIGFIYTCRILFGGGKVMQNKNQKVEKLLFQRITKLILLILIILLIGTFYYHYTENLPIIDSFFFTIISVSTVGYTLPKENFSNASKIFTSVLIVSGISAFTYGLSNIAAIFFEESARSYFKRRRMKRMIEKLTDHIIVVDITKATKYLVYELLRHDVDVVIVGEDEEEIRKIVEQLPEKERHGRYYYVLGDGRDENTLLEAGLKRAKTLVAAYGDDTLNVFVTLTAKSINPNIKVISGATDIEDVKKLYYAGADVVIATSEIAGFELAKSALEKTGRMVFSFEAFGKKTLKIEYLKVEKNFKCIGQKVSECDLFKKYEITVIAIESEGKLILKDDDKNNHVLKENDVLIVAGLADMIENFFNELAV